MKWRGTISFDEWVLIVHGKVDVDKKLEIWKEVNHVHNDDQFPNNETNDFTSEKDQGDTGGDNKHWCEKVRIHHENGISYWASCNPYEEKCDGGSSKERIGNTSYYWKSTNDSERSELPWVNGVTFNDWVKIKYGKTDSSTKERIWKEHSKSMDEDEQEDSYEENYEIEPKDERNQKILDLIEEKLDKNWYKDTESDNDDLGGIIYYLELQGYDGFVDEEDEAYEQRRCKLLGIPYKKPPPIITEKFEVVRYSIGPDEQFTKIESQGKEELLRTATNVAWIREHLMKEMDERGQVLHEPT